MKFGIEIEFGGDLNRLLTELHTEGLVRNTSVAGYIGFDHDYWVVKRDGSVQGGGELVSPPLNFEDEGAMEQINKACAALQRAGCRPTQQTGIHVHIESRGMTPRQISAVARFWTRYEDAIYRIASSGWESLRRAAHQYARPLTDSQKKGLANARTEEALQRAYYGRDRTGSRFSHGEAARYAGLNLHSHWYRGTIEFRVFNGSVNAERIQAYVALCHAIIQDAKNDKLRSVKSGVVALGSMARGEAEEDKVLFNLLAILRYQAGMSKDHYRLIKKYWADSRPQNFAPTYY